MPTQPRTSQRRSAVETSADGGKDLSSRRARTEAPPPVDSRARGRVMLSRRTLCYVLGLLWLLDGALQLQSFMFTAGFAHQVIAPAAAGQPWFVAVPINWNARLIGGHPALLNAFFAGTQLALGSGFILKRTIRVAIIASSAWAVCVWYLGEGLGGLASGHVTALVGAPGAAILYVVLAAAAWPVGPVAGDQVNGSGPSPLSLRRPPRWVIGFWSALWLGSAVLNLLPRNFSASALSSQVSVNISSVPSWLAAGDRAVASGIERGGLEGVLATVMIELAIGLLSLSRSRFQLPAVYAGMALAGLYWAVGQSFGQLFSGQATDPSTGPLVVAVGLAAIGAIRSQGSARQSPSRAAPARRPALPLSTSRRVRISAPS